MKKLLSILLFAFCSLSIFAADKPLRILVMGDDPAAAMYGPLLSEYFNELVTVDVLPANQMQSSDATTLLNAANKGDVVLLCKRENPAEAKELSIEEAYLASMESIQKAANKRGIKLIWLTPVSPRYFTAEGVQIHRYGVYPDVMRRMVKRDQLPFIDLEQLTFDWLTELGLQASEMYYEPTPVIASEYHEKAARTGSELTQDGAKIVAEKLMEGLKALKLNYLKKYFK